MLPTFRPARSKSAKSFVSALALGAALIGGAALSSAIAPAVAVAQEYSDEFVTAYQPIEAVVNAEGGDLNSVSGQFPGLVALAANADEKDAAGSLILNAGITSNNTAWQRQGLELRLASGKVPPESLGQFNWFVGNLALQAQDYLASRAALEAAVANGWTQDDPVGLIAETYYQVDDISGGANFIVGEADKVLAAGGTIPHAWPLRGLQAAYEYGNFDAARIFGLMLVEYHPSQTHWTNALQVMNALADIDDSVQLDLDRLMRTTNSMVQAHEYARYIAAADPRIMSNELDGLVAQAVREGHFETDDPYYQDIRSTIDGRMAGDREDAPTMVIEAEQDASGESAMLAGDVLLSLSDWAGAEAMYLMAAEKGGVDANLALLRAGMMQARQGKGAEAIGNFERVTGPRELAAQFWTAYAKSL